MENLLSSFLFSLLFVYLFLSPFNKLLKINVPLLLLLFLAFHFYYHSRHNENVLDVRVNHKASCLSNLLFFLMSQLF